MVLTEGDVKKFSVIFLVIILAVLVFILIKPVILSIIGGLILAYAFFPLYKIVLKSINNKNLAAVIVSLVVITLIILPLYFIIPYLVQQVFDIFKYSQTVDVRGFLQSLFPSAPESFIVQMTTIFSGLVSKMSSFVLDGLVDFLIEIPTILFHLVIVAFVFFFALRDSNKLSEFVGGLSPLNKVQEKKLIQQFKDITNTVVYGQILIGLVQGIIAGLGFFMFGIPGALILTILSIVFSIIPIIGPFLIWIPATVYLFLQGHNVAGVIYLLYNILITSNIDNLLRLYLISKKTDLSQVIVLIGMVGGLFIFGILGLLLGPLILAYFIVFLKAYKENSLSSLFKNE